MILCICEVCLLHGLSEPSGPFLIIALQFYHTQIRSRQQVIHKFEDLKMCKNVYILVSLLLVICYGHLEFLQVFFLELIAVCGCVCTPCLLCMGCFFSDAVKGETVHMSVL